MVRKSFYRSLALAVVSSILGGNEAWATINIDTVPVGDVGNVADTRVMSDGTTGYGRVTYNYNIGKYDVTAAQYAAFLNAVAQTDTYGLYNTSMATSPYGCGITQSGTSGSYSYGTTRNGNFPVNYVSFGDSMRFANWLQNGQPTGAQGPGTTEDGAYFVNGATSNVDLQAVSRKSNWQWAVTSEDEWYKAAYYDPNKYGVGNAGYWAYATRSDAAPSNVLSATSTNNANHCNGNYIYGGFTDPVNYLTAVGAFAASPSPYGTFDQSGDVTQWNEAIFTSGSYSFRGLRGGSFFNTAPDVGSDFRNGEEPMVEGSPIGFRVSQVQSASVPVPAAAWAGGVGLLCMAVVRRMRRR